MNEVISSVVTISPAFAEEVNLKRDFLHPEENARRLKGYIPPQKVRAALRGILEGLHPASQMRVHLITGAYGAGKSHFGLVLANLVSRDPDDRTFEPLFSRLSQKEQQLVDFIKHMRQSTGKYLVVLPEPYGDPEGFHHSLLASLSEALHREGSDFEPPTVFRAALDCIENWRANDPAACQKLEATCLRHSKTIEMVIDELRSYKGTAYSLFKEMHKEVAHGAPFLPQLTADPTRVYDETIKYLSSTGKWRGIFIFYDEFSTYLRHMAEDPHALEGQQLQAFAEYCKRSGENQCHLVVIAHQTLQDYARGKRSEEEWSKIYGRFLSGEYLLAVAGEHEMEEIIDSILLQRKESDTWKQLSTHSDFNILADIVKDAVLYPMRSMSWVESTFLRGCYPLHPYTTFCLPWVANYVVRQRERTLFTFFGRPSEEGLRKFIEIHSVLRPDGRLNLYTADRLFAYYKEQIHGHPDYRYIAKAAENALSFCGDSPLGARAVKLIAILTLINHPQLPPTQRVVIDGLHLSPGQEKELTQVLTELVNRRALRFRPVTKRYELPGRPGIIDAKEAIDKTKGAILAEGFALIGYLNRNQPLSSIEAHTYAEKHFTRRHAIRQFVDASHLSNPKMFIERIGSWYKPDRGKYEGDALVLYVVADSISDINNAQACLIQGLCKHPQLVVAIPKTPVMFSEMALELAAIQRIREQGLKIEEGEIDSEDVAGIEKDIKVGLTNGLNDFLQADNLTWYWNGNVVASMPQGGEEQFISQVFEQVFPKTPRIRDEAIANPVITVDKSKKDRWTAIDTLLQVKGPFQIRKKGGSAPDRILRSCLRDVELLEKKFDKGGVEEFEVRDSAPANSELSEIWGFLNKQIVAAGGKIIPAAQVVQPLIEPPYGLTNQEVEVLLAASLRNRCDDTLVFRNFKEAARAQNYSLLESVPLNGQSITALVQDPTDFVLCYYEMLPAEHKYVDEIVRLTKVDEEALASYRSWERAKKALLAWYGALLSVTKTASDFENSYCKTVLEVLAKLEKAGQAREILQNDLPIALGIDIATVEPKQLPYEQILISLESVLSELNSHAQAKESKLLAEVGAIFGAKGNTQSEAAEAIKAWYNFQLTEAQRMHPFSGDERFLLRAAREEGAILQRMLYTLAENMGLKSFREWETDNSELFLAKLKLAKQSIEGWDPTKPPPGPDGDEGGKVLARAQIQAIFKKLGIPKSAQIEVLSSLLEEIEK